MIVCSFSCSCFTSCTEYDDDDPDDHVNKVHANSAKQVVKTFEEATVETHARVVVIFIKLLQRKYK